MQFNSYSYLLLLLPVVAVYWLLPQAARRYYLLTLSLVFYASWNAAYTLLPFVICGIAWLCAVQMTRNASKSGFWLKVGITAVLVILAFFKYRTFLLQNVNAVLAALGSSPVTVALRLALPLGISFYSFEAISYLIDKRQGRVKDPQLLDLSLFVAFWPHLIAGPIVRVRELIPQFHQRREFDLTVFLMGLDRLLWGIVQKNLLANNLGAWVDEGFLPQAARSNSMLDNWTLAVAFGLQIYFDFASYSNMAIGTAHLVGITLPENFRFPYHAANPSDFWSRWHMTLSRWIRDYLFFPINAKYKGAPGPLYLSLIGIMALVGLWHGAGWGFVLWGIFHGVYLVLYRTWESMAERNPGWAGSAAWSWFWRAFTVVAVTVAWVPFRASSFEQTLTMLKTMFVRPGFWFSYNVNFYLVTLLIALFCVMEPYLAKGWDAVVRRVTASASSASFGPVLLRPLLYALALLIFLVLDDQDTQFIYFQF